MINRDRNQKPALEIQRIRTSTTMIRERDDIDLLIPHQANIRIIEAVRKRFGLTENQIKKYGNTSSSSMAIAWDEAIREGRAHSGDLLVIVGFGGGLTWGATAVRLK